MTARRVLAGPLALLLLGAAPPPGTVSWSHLYDLSHATGVASSTWAHLVYDREHRELFVINGGLVSVYNESGMETYRFGDDGELGPITGLALLDGGGMLIVTSERGVRKTVRCTFRGERVGEFRIGGLPPDLSAFSPTDIVRSGAELYFVDLNALRVVVTDGDGAFKRTYDLARILGVNPRKATDYDLSAFAVDPAGDLLFTAPMLFTALVVSPAGKVSGFGTRGSTPGKFNIAGGIAADEDGNYFVTDRLRSVVMVFDPKLRFLDEFGYRGEDEENLNTPYDIAVGNGKVFVSQAGSRGVRAFLVKVTRAEEPPPVVTPVAPVAAAAEAPRPRPRVYSLIEVKTERIVIKQQVHFATAKWRVLRDSFPLLNQVVQALNDYPDIRVSIEGHTDNVGTEAYNLDLSQKRAEAVRDYLVKKGISPARLEAIGYGYTRPIAWNRISKGKMRNRRTEFRIIR